MLKPPGIVVYNSRTVDNHIYLCMLRRYIRKILVLELCIVMVGCSELFIKLVLMRGFYFLINHLLVLKFRLDTGGRYTSQQKCWDFSILEVLF